MGNNEQGSNSLKPGCHVKNDKKWYEQFGEIEYSANKNRPMNPIYITDFTKDATKGGMGKMVDVFVDMPDYVQTIGFEAQLLKMFKVLRQHLRSNMPYSMEKLEHYIVDSLGIVAIVSQIQRQLAFQDFAPEGFPDFQELWNKIGESDSGYGVQHLVELSEYDEDDRATAIENYDVLIDYLNNILRAPKHFTDMLQYYFGNLFRSESDESNPQYIAMRLNKVLFTNYDNPDESYGYIDCSQLSIRDTIVLARKYAKYYGLQYSDSDTEKAPAKLFTAVSFANYKQLNHKTVYSTSVFQALINGYTNSAHENGYLRLDQLTAKDADPYTQFLFLGAPNEAYNSASPVYTPTFKIKSMQLKVLSNAELEWGHALDQDLNFDYSEDFAIVLNSEVQSDDVVNIMTANTGIALNQIFELDEDVEQKKFTLSIGQTAGQLPQGYTKHSSDTTTQSFTSSVAQFRAGDAFLTLPIAAIVAGEATTGVLIYQKYKIQYINDGLVFSNLGIYVCTNAPLTTGPATNGYLWIYGSTYPFSAEISIDSEDSFYSWGDHDKYIVNSSNPVTISIYEPYILEDGTSNVEFDTSAEAGISYSINIANNTLQSFRGASFEGEEAVRSVAAMSGFTGLVSFMADQLDFHLPVFIKHKTTVIIDNDTSEAVVVDSGTVLVKENYVPYMYNLKDLNGVLYKMYNSLIYDVSYRRGNKSSDKADKRNKNSKTEDKKGEESK